MAGQFFWNAPSHWPLALGLAGMVIALTFWLYPRQLHGVNRFWALVLPALRVLAVAAVSLSLVKPTLVRPRTQEEQGAIIILVDRSRSMSIADSQLSPPEQIAIADALAMIPEGKRNRQAADASAGLRRLERAADRAARAETDLDYTRLTDRQVQQRSDDCDEAYKALESAATDFKTKLQNINVPEQLAGKLANLNSPATPQQRSSWRKDLLQATAGMGELLRQRQTEADASLYQSDPAIQDACRNIVKESRFRLVERLLTDDAAGMLARFGKEVPLYGYAFADALAPLPLQDGGGQAVKRLLCEPDGAQSRGNDAILGILEEFKGLPIRGIIVLSDGRWSGNSGASAAFSAGIPIFTVACGSEHSYSDLAISAVEAPASAYAGENVPVTVHLKATNLPPGEFDLTATCGTESQVRKVAIDAAGAGAADFLFRPTSAGVFHIQVQTQNVQGEATTQNNAYSRPLKVIQDKLNVMLVTTYASWDYQYVRNALARTQWARLTDVLAQGPRLPVTADAIAQQDVLLLLGIRPQMLNAQQVDALHRAVTEKGASVILVPGAVDDLDEFAVNPLLDDFLPYRAGGRPSWRTWPGDRPAFHIVPAPGSRTVDAIRLAEDGSESESRWANLPAVYRYLALPQLKPNVLRTMLIEKESRAPILTESRVGIGRVFFFGINESWRWRLRVAERDQDRFWLQLIRYSAEEPYSLVGKDLALDLDKVTAHPGEDVKARVRQRSDPGAKPPMLEILRNGRLMRVEELTERGQLSPGRYEAVIRDLPQGHYEVLARQPGQGSTSLKMPLDVRYDPLEELADISADFSALRQMSRLSGGSSLRLADAAGLPNQIARVAQRRGPMTEIPLWSSASLFTLVLGLLSLEWAVRKRLGMA